MNNTTLQLDNETNVVIKPNGNVLFFQKDIVTKENQIIVITEDDVQKLIKFLTINHINKI